ncbi:alpha/beta hydrolase [Salsipaludibacter albus]|uniref:alpha/beta hydrolase n=1 Tax=Salsipaludibacter albus TaxID=2849650 RepID=UPI001EE46D28|nr:alpha/beta fold hydrolase [Salsipaludibacter albus]MBY5161090.1 lysophospholipase [Salsipaludibacter albus]
MVDEPAPLFARHRPGDGGPGNRRRATLAGVSALASAAAAGVGVASHYARRLTDPPTAIPEDPPRDDERVTIHAVGDGDVLLAGPGADRPGVWGVVTATGYGRIGATRRHTPAGVRRPFELVDGEVTPSHAVLDAHAHVNLPTSLHPDGTELQVPGPIGAMPAHFVPGDDTWVVGVHGRAAWRHETFRALGPAVAAGHTALAISYRNDHDAPPSPDGRSHLGDTEWEDLAAALDLARDRGARRIVLVGCSMGGAIVGQALARADATGVVGVVLDAPVVDWHPVVARAARDLGVPGPAVGLLMAPTRLMARARHRVDLSTLGFDPHVLTVPTLVVHGVDDEVVPVAGSDDLASRRPDVVTYLRVPGAGHVRSWNVDPATHEAAVRALLRRVAPD